MEIKMGNKNMVRSSQVQIVRDVEILQKKIYFFWFGVVWGTIMCGVYISIHNAYWDCIVYRVYSSAAGGGGGGGGGWRWLEQGWA